MGSAYRAVSDPSVRFTYAVNPFMVGNLADTPFDGQTAILQRGRRGRGCHYVGDRHVRRPVRTCRVYRSYAGRQAAVSGARAVGGARRRARAAARRRRRRSPAGTAGYRYVQTAVIADLPFPADRDRPGCVMAGR